MSSPLLLLLSAALVPSEAVIRFTTFSSSDCSGPPSALGTSLAWSNACGIIGGVYGTGLTQCSGTGANSPLELALYTGASPPTCAGSPFTSFLSPLGVGVCVQVTGPGTVFANSFIFSQDPTDLGCQLQPGGAILATMPQPGASSCSSTYMVVQASSFPGTCRDSSFGPYASQVTVDTVSSTASVLVGTTPSGCSDPQLFSFPAIALDGVCASGTSPSAGGSVFMAAQPLQGFVPPTPSESASASPTPSQGSLPSAAFSGTPAPSPPPPAFQPPSLPGTAATMELYFGGSDCSGQPTRVQGGYLGECAPLINYGLRVDACSPGASAALSVFQDSPGISPLQAPTCRAAPVANPTLFLGVCTPIGPGIFARLIAAPCAPTPPNSVFAAAAFSNSSSCEDGSGFFWSTLEVPPNPAVCLSANGAGTGNSSALASGLDGSITFTGYFTISEQQAGCNGFAVQKYAGLLPALGNCVVDSLPYLSTRTSMRLLAPGGSVPGSSGSASATPSAAPGGASPSPSPTPRPPVNPPSLPGTAGSLLLFSSPDCSGPPSFALGVYEGLCSALNDYGVALDACQPGLSATVSLYANPAPSDVLPPTCGPAAPASTVVLPLNVCTEFLTVPGGGPGGPTVIKALLAAAPCAPTPPNTVFSAAVFRNSAVCEAATGFSWFTLEAPVDAATCLSANGGVPFNSTARRDPATGVVDFAAYTDSPGIGQGCSGFTVESFSGLKVAGNCVGDSAGVFTTPQSMRIAAPGVVGSPSTTPSPSSAPGLSVTASSTVSDSSSATPSPTPSPSAAAASGSDSATPSATPSETPTPTSTFSAGLSASGTGTSSDTGSGSPLPSPTGSPTPSSTPSPSASPAAATGSDSSSATPSSTASPTTSLSSGVSPSETSTLTLTATGTDSPSLSATCTDSPSLSATGSGAGGLSVSPSPSPTPSPTATPSLSPSASASTTSTASSGASASDSASSSSTLSLTPTGSDSASLSDTPSASATPSPSPSSTPSQSPSQSSTPSPTLSTGATPYSTPAATPSPTHTPSPSPTPSHTHSPTGSRVAPSQLSGTATRSPSPSLTPTGGAGGAAAAAAAAPALSTGASAGIGIGAVLVLGGLAFFFCAPSQGRVLSRACSPSAGGSGGGGGGAQAGSQAQGQWAYSSNSASAKSVEMSLQANPLNAVYTSGFRATGSSV